MNEQIVITTPIVNNAYKKYVPILTLICCLVSIVLFIGINLEGKLDNWDVYRKWGSPSVADIFNGSFWGLITSNFLHIELWHIAFNLYWLWIFGKKIEYESKKTFYAFLILSSALVSSLAQLSFADTTGIGLSGIGYSLFGFIFVKSKTTEEYKNFLDKRTITLSIFWLFFCIVLTQTKVLLIGNAAHIGGLLWGMTVAYISKFAIYKQWAIGLLLFSALTSLIFWNPFSTSWLSHQAYELHQSQKFDEAIVVYRKILERDNDNKFAKINLKQLEVHKLQEKAIELHQSQKVDEAIVVYRKILERDNDNKFAKVNLKQLEVYKLQEKAIELHSNLKYDGARKLYNQILSIDKDNEWAKENLTRLPNE